MKKFFLWIKWHFLGWNLFWSIFSFLIGVAYLIDGQVYCACCAFFFLGFFFNDLADCIDNRAKNKDRSAKKQ